MAGAHLGRDRGKLQRQVFDQGGADRCFKFWRQACRRRSGLSRSAAGPDRKRRFAAADRAPILPACRDAPRRRPPPTTAPIEVPTMTLGTMPWAISVRTMPIWAKPRAAPPPSASPITGRRRPALSWFSLRPHPTIQHRKQSPYGVGGRLQREAGYGQNGRKAWFMWGWDRGL